MWLIRSIMKWSATSQRNTYSATTVSVNNRTPCKRTFHNHARCSASKSRPRVTERLCAAEHIQCRRLGIRQCGSRVWQCGYGALISPHLREAGMLYVAIGIIGATVMPHNLYVHSAFVQSRKLQQDVPSMRKAIHFNIIDSTIAVSVVFFVNATILGSCRDSIFAEEKCSGRGGHIVHFSAESDLRRIWRNWRA